jgi:hypothetical protein
MTQSIQGLELEIDNIRAAMAPALATPSEPALPVKLGVALQSFWLLRGRDRAVLCVEDNATVDATDQTHAS